MKEINYIVSGLERSGTSMMMQILKAGNIPIAYDTQRKPDENNPKGYYELSNGLIIRELMDGKFLLDKYKGKFIKITSYGISFLPKSNYKIIYLERDIEEILDSMEKMIRKVDMDRDMTRDTFSKLNEYIKKYMERRNDMDVLILNYNQIIKNKEKEIKKILDFLDLNDTHLTDMILSIDNTLYRQRNND